jgi:hypothetical protein
MAEKPAQMPKKAQKFNSAYLKWTRKAMDLLGIEYPLYEKEKKNGRIDTK